MSRLCIQITRPCLTLGARPGGGWVSVRYEPRCRPTSPSQIISPLTTTTSTDYLIHSDQIRTSSYASSSIPPCRHVLPINGTIRATVTPQLSPGHRGREAS